jgi:peptide/nickel transport system substrate-binding protein
VWRRAYRGLSDRWGPSKLLEEFLVEWDAPDSNTLRVVPNVVEKWEQSADATEFTWYLRPGMKWSDGVEVTTEDVRFYHEDVELNPEVRPTPKDPLHRQRVGNEYQLAQFEYLDKYAFKAVYPAPAPLIPITIARGGTSSIVGGAGYLGPAHYLKKHLPKYAPVEELNKLASARGLPSWQASWGQAGDFTQGWVANWFVNPDLPVLFPWRCAKPAPADPMVAERNPFYWQVDSSGNQLPYIDRIEHSLYENPEVLKLWVAQGKIDMQMRYMDTSAYTFYMENRRKGNYRVFRWRGAATYAYLPNLNVADPVLRQLFETPAFRQALNLAINREWIADLVYNGLARARQASPVPGSMEYDLEFEQKWTEYDPEQANALLDSIGLLRGSDGVRRRPDGRPLEITIEYTEWPYFAPVDMHELVKGYWNAIGVRTTTNYVERSLYEVHARNGEIEMGFRVVDRSAVPKADPLYYVPTSSDYVPGYANWYTAGSAAAGAPTVEPPVGHPIRRIFELWDQCRVEPDEATRNAMFQEILNIHKEAPFWIGVVGEPVLPMIAKETFRNVGDSFISDDSLRDSGLLNAQQYFIRSS